MMLPTVFARIGSNTMYIFGAVNLLSILMVWALYPETANRSLEQVDYLFAADSIWNWDAEKSFQQLSEQMTETNHTRRRSAVHDAEKGITINRNGSAHIVHTADDAGDAEKQSSSI